MNTKFKVVLCTSILLLLALTSCYEPKQYQGTVTAVVYRSDWNGGLTTVYFSDMSSVSFEGRSSLEVGKTYTLVVTTKAGNRDRNELVSVSSTSGNITEGY